MEENKNQKQNKGPIIVIICLLLIIIGISSYLINNISKKINGFELSKVELLNPDTLFNKITKLEELFIETKKIDNDVDNNEKAIYKKAYNSEEIINIIKDYPGLFFNDILCIEIKKDEAIIKTIDNTFVYIEFIDFKNWSSESVERVSRYLNDNFAGINGIHSSYFMQKGSIYSGKYYKEKDNTYLIDFKTIFFNKDGSSIRLIIYIDEDTLNQIKNKTNIPMEEIINTVG